LEEIPYESLIETNGFELGKNAAKTAKQILNNQGELAVGLWTDVKITSIDNRANGLIDELTKNSNIKVHPIKSFSNASDEVLTKFFAEIKRDYPNTKVVYAINGNWGVACGNYINKHHLDYDVITVDLRKDTAEMIKEGKIKAAIAQRAFTWVTSALEILVDVYQNKPVVKYTDTGTYEANRANISIYERRI
jgi:ABC-type sugar transport system substrate-binding protein